MSPDALDSWDGFMKDYGWRGPDDMDVANPRYGDDPRIVLSQIAPMAVADACDLEALHAGHIRSRAVALAEIRAQLGPIRRRVFDRLARTSDLFAGARDTPKHINVLCNYVIRQGALREAERLLASGRLDRIEHVFDLTFEDLRDAAHDRGLDLRALRAERIAHLKRVAAQVKTFPPVIDSRGRILRPPKRCGADGLFPGVPVSAGIVQGPVRVLRDPNTAKIEPGEILVAYTTDPGWTPLFANASAVVLEVGGVLQHGAVIAREFRKPCIVGIPGIADILQDGELVEVDGAAGSLQRLSPPAAPSSPA